VLWLPKIGVLLGCVRCNKECNDCCSGRSIAPSDSMHAHCSVRPRYCRVRQIAISGSELSISCLACKPAGVRQWLEILR